MGTILDRAVRIWESSDFAYLDPILAVEQPEAFAIGHRIATEYPREFRNELLALLDSDNANVVAHALAIIWRSGVATPNDIPTSLLADLRTVTIPGCIQREHTIAELARDCIANLESGT